MALFRTCLEIAACAGAEKRRYTLAITYDELCRKQWNLKADRGDRGFEVNVASLEKDKNLLERARALYDAANAGAKALSMLDIFLNAHTFRTRKMMPDPLVRRIRKETRKVCASICGVLHISIFCYLNGQVETSSVRTIGLRAMVSPSLTAAVPRGTRRAMIRPVAGEGRAANGVWIVGP
jgi:hypothetical protein